MLEKNIWKYGLHLIANKRIYIAVLGAYYLTIPGVNPQVVGLLLLAGSLAGFIFEIPSGYVSDKIGHKQALIVSRVLMLVSTLFFLFADRITFLVLGSIFLSASSAFQSGTGSAFMHETLRALKRENEYTKIMGRVSSVGFAVPIIFTVLVPFFVSVSYKVPFVVALFVDIVGLFAVLSLTVPPVEQEHVDEIGATNFRQVIKEGYRLNYFSLALFSGIIGGTFLGVSGFRAVYQTFLVIPVIWFGVLFGIGRAFASLLLAYSGSVRKNISLPYFYTFEIISYTLLIFGLGLVSDPWIVAILFIVINAFQWGFSRVDEGYQLEVIKSSKFKATLLSTGAQIEQAVGAVAGFSIGFLIHKFSYQTGFLYSAIIFLTALLPVYLYVLHRYKRGAYGMTA